MAAKKKYIIEFDADVSGLDAGVNEVNESVEEVNGSFETLEGTVDQFTGGLVSGLKSGLGGVKKMVAGMRTLKGAILSTGVGALVIGLASLVSWMKNTEAGSKTLRTASTALDIVWKDMSTSLNKLIDGDGKEPKDSWMSRLLRHLPPQLHMFRTAYDVAETKAKAMADTEFELIDVTKSLTVENANLNSEIEKQQKNIDNTTLSFKERKAAVDAQNIATEQLAKNIAKEAKLEEEKLSNQIKIVGTYEETIELQQQLAEATARRIDAETKIAIVQLDNAQKSREIDMIELARKKSIFDTIANLKLESISDEEERINAEFDLRKTNLEAELDLLGATDQERLDALALLNEGRILALQEFHEAERVENEAQLESFRTAEQKYADEQAAIKDKAAKDDEARAKDDEARAKQRVADRRSETDQYVAIARAGNDLLSNLMDAFGKEGDKFAKRRFKINKALALVDAGVQTALAIVRGFADSGYPGAILGGLTGAASIVAIASKQFNPSGGGSSSAPRPPSPSSVSAGNESTPSAPSVDFSFLDSGANQTSVQAYVVEQDVSSSQQANQLIEDQASL